MAYIFDLDGTLIDSSDRMYQLFCKLVPQCSLTKNEYWKYKRNKINHKMLIDMLYSDIDFEVFNAKWMQEIEKKQYLDMDVNYPDTITVLKELKGRGNTIFLLTARQSKVNLYYELSRLNLLNYFDTIMVTENKISKKSLLQQYGARFHDLMKRDNIFISDMGKDIIIGKWFKFYTVGISHGFMALEKLVEYEPDKIINDLFELL